MSSKKFTLIELLVVVAIIGILVSILMPSLQRARYKAKLKVCTSNQRQIGVGLLIYAADNDDLYPSLNVGGFKAQCDWNAHFKHYFEKFQTDGVSYNIYAGFSVDNNASKMDKVGSTLDHNGNSYNVLSMDFIIGRSSGAFGETTHPGGGMEKDVRDSTPCVSRWAGSSRGKVDLNVQYDDGSVRLIQKVGLFDSRFDLIPYHFSGSTRYLQYIPEPDLY